MVKTLTYECEMGGVYCKKLTNPKVARRHFTVENHYLFVPGKMVQEQKSRLWGSKFGQFYTLPGRREEGGDNRDAELILVQQNMQQPLPA